MLDPYHPLWTTVHWAVVILLIGAVLWLNASSFDDTEIKSLIQLAGIIGGLFGGQAWLAKRRATQYRAQEPSQEAEVQEPPEAM